MEKKSGRPTKLITRRMRLEAWKKKLRDKQIEEWKKKHGLMGKENIRCYDYNVPKLKQNKYNKYMNRYFN